MQLTFDIPDAKAQRLIQAINALHPIHDEVDMTPAQWAKEFMRRWMIGQVQRHEKNIALAAVDVGFENDLIT